MKANEFIKKSVWDDAIALVNASNICGVDKSIVDIEDLKRLVGSWELVQVGLPELKKSMFSDSKDLDYVKNWLLNVSEKLLTDKGVKLKQAILDVESCQ